MGTHDATNYIRCMTVAEAFNLHCQLHYHLDIVNTTNLMIRKDQRVGQDHILPSAGSEDDNFRNIVRSKGIAPTIGL
jgi:hypothetical protein